MECDFVCFIKVENDELNQYPFKGTLQNVERSQRPLTTVKG